MSRTTEILQKALDELGATEEEEPASSSLELLLAESIKLANLKKVAQRISKTDFLELFEEMKERYRRIGALFTYYQSLALFGMLEGPDLGGPDFADNIAGRELALKAYKQLQITIAQLEIPSK